MKCARCKHDGASMVLANYCNKYQVNYVLCTRCESRFTAGKLKIINLPVASSVIMP